MTERRGEFEVATPTQLGGVQLTWKTIGEIVSAEAETYPDREAVSFDDGPTLTCGDLDRRSDALAAGLADLGIGKHDRIVTLMNNSVEQILFWLAAAKLGAIAVPLNISLRGADLAHALAVSAASLIIVEGELLEEYQDAKRIAAITIEHEAVVRGDHRGFADFSDLESQGGSYPPAVDIGPQDPVCVVFTGGTTGMPKGVLRSHFSYVCAAARYRQAFMPTPADRHYSAGAFFHIGGQEGGFFSPFVNGVPTRLSSWFSASRFWDRVRDHEATIIEAVGARVTLLLRQPARPDDAQNSVRAALSGTRGITLEARREFMRRFGVPRLVEVYAMSETGSLLFYGDSEDENDCYLLDSHGWCESAVVDQRGFAVPEGELGEILLRPSVPYSTSLGYLGDPVATVERWRDQWIHTGDVGRHHADGRLEFVGRQAHWLRRRGENISAVEVEAVLDSHPAVLESAVVGTPSELGEEDVRAVVVLRDGFHVPVEELFDWCEARIAYFKVPRYIEIRAEPLPRSATKREIERHLIRDQKMEDPAERLPRNPRIRRTGNH